MTKIYLNKYIAEFGDESMLMSFEDVFIPQDSVRYLDLDFVYNFYYCSSCTTYKNQHNTYGMKGKYRTYWRKIVQRDKAVKVPEGNFPEGM